MSCRLLGVWLVQYCRIMCHYRVRYLLEKKKLATKFFGLYFHALLIHSPPQAEIANLRSLNTEAHEGMVCSIKSLGKCCTNSQPAYVIPHLLQCLQGKRIDRQQHRTSYSAQTQQDRLRSKAFKLTLNVLHHILKVGLVFGGRRLLTVSCFSMGIIIPTNIRKVLVVCIFVALTCMMRCTEAMNVGAASCHYTFSFHCLTRTSNCTVPQVTSLVIIFPSKHLSKVFCMMRSQCQCAGEDSLAIFHCSQIGSSFTDASVPTQT